MKLGITLLTIFIIALFIIEKGNRQDNPIEAQEEIQEDEWQVKEDGTAAIGSNLFSNSSMVEGNNSVYVLDIGRYGGKPVNEDERYSIYQVRENEREMFVSEFPLGESDINSISNLVYWDGYIYYALKEVDVWMDGTEVIENGIYRISEDAEYLGLFERPQDWILSCDTNFFIYEGEIYYKFHDKGIRYFYKASLDGEDREVLYSDEQEDAAEFDYAVGGGCLYLKDGEHILGINLMTGQRKSFVTSAEHIEGMFYENGILFIYDSENKEIYQMDVRTCSESKLIEEEILEDCVWLHGEYLYYVVGEAEIEGFRCKLKAMNTKTGESILWESILFETQPFDAELEMAGSRVTASFWTKRENDVEEYQYCEKEASEIVDAGNMKVWEIMSGEEKSEKRTVVIQEGFQESKWRVKEDDETVIGHNFNNSGISASGNGCIYSTDIGMYDGKPPEEEGEENDANIYRLKEGKWELFVSHPVIEEEPWWAEISVHNLTYYDGYLYYILLRDYDPGTGNSGKYYSIYRVSEEGGDVEKLVECNGSFYIYQDKIYYDNYIKGRQYSRMELDGSSKELIYFDDGKDYNQFAYAIGGGYLFLWDKEQIMGISLENDKEKIFTYFEVPVKVRHSMFYEDGKLYFFDASDPIIYQLDVRTGEVSKALENFSDYECGELLDYDCIHLSESQYMDLYAEFFRNHIWICNDYLYYIEWERTREGDNYGFKVMDVSTGEIIIWESAFVEKEFITWSSLLVAKSPLTSINLEVIGSDVIARISVKHENDVIEDRCFRKEISEIMEQLIPKESN